MTIKEKGAGNEDKYGNRNTKQDQEIGGSVSSVRLGTSYYASLCWFALSELGLTGNPPNAEYERWVHKIESVGEAFGFKPPVAGGPMFQMLYQIPSYLDPDGIQALDDVKTCISATLHTHSMACFRETWPIKTKTWGTWYETTIDDASQAMDLVEVFFAFIEEMWDTYRARYTHKLERVPFHRYEDELRAAAIFRRWEEALGVPYPYAEFIMNLCPETPSYASSVGPDAIVFGLQRGPDAIVPSAIHEIGVRYSNLDYLKRYEPTKAIMRTDYVNFLRIIEAETCYRKMEIFPEIEVDHFLSPAWEALVAWRAHQEATDAHYYDHLAQMYGKANEDGIL